MKLTLVFITQLLLVFNYAQNNSIVINNNAFIVLNNGTAGNETVVVVDQVNANGITTAGTGGNIITMGEFDYLKWNNKTGTGTYTIPFTTDIGLVKIPLSINITSAGVGNGYLALSTWDVSTGGGQFDNTPYPSDVIHMGGADGSADVSESVVDRFWVIDISDPLGTGELFTTNPVASIGFNYNNTPAEIGDGNTLNVGDLVAQQYDGLTDKWHGWFSGGFANGIYGSDNGSGLVSGVVPPVGAWFRTWTLSDEDDPLPVELTYFDGQCEKEGIVLQWQTASEINNDYFEIQKSLNGIDFEIVTTVTGAGNSSSYINYSFTDEFETFSGAFYQISQVDFDGTRKDYPIIKTSPCLSNGNITIYSPSKGEIILEINLSNSEEVQVQLVDNLGKEVGSAYQFTGQDGYNRFQLIHEEVAFGNYFVVVKTPSINTTTKVNLR